MKIIKLERSLFAIFVAFWRSSYLYFLLLIVCSVQSVFSVCWLILYGRFIVNLMRALICEMLFYISASTALSFLKKATSHKYRQYQFPLIKNNTLNMIHRNLPELYIYIYRDRQWKLTVLKEVVRIQFSWKNYSYFLVNTGDVAI